MNRELKTATGLAGDGATNAKRKAGAPAYVELRHNEVRLLSQIPERPEGRVYEVGTYRDVTPDNQPPRPKASITSNATSEPAPRLNQFGVPRPPSIFADD